MVFNGIYPPTGLTPTPCGLLGVANVRNHRSTSYDETWIRGFDAEFISNPHFVRLLSLYETTVIDGELYEAAPNSFNFTSVMPFFIEVEDTHGTLGIVAEDRFSKILKQLDAVTQKAIEYELWEGAAAKEHPNVLTRDDLYLTKTGGAVILGAGGVSDIARAVSLAEQAIASSPTGGNGIIHCTRDVASFATSAQIFHSVSTEDDTYMVTTLGTPVVVGSGYTGAGPDGAVGAAPTISNKWIYVTGAVDVHLGKAELDNDDLSQGFSPATNDITIKANRPAAVYFDPSIFAAVRVTLPAVA